MTYDYALPIFLAYVAFATPVLFFNIVLRFMNRALSGFED